MNIYDAIMNAANYIGEHPTEFSFIHSRVPKCGTPGCALGWIAHFLGAEPDGNVLTATSKALGLEGRMMEHTNCEFYRRMDALENPNFPEYWIPYAKSWRKNAAQCKSTLSLYAQKYHAPAKPKRTDAELVSYWTARVRQQALDEHAQSEELAW